MQQSLPQRVPNSVRRVPSSPPALRSPLRGAPRELGAPTRTRGRISPREKRTMLRKSWFTLAAMAVMAFGAVGSANAHGGRNYGHRGGYHGGGYHSYHHGHYHHGYPRYSRYSAYYGSRYAPYYSGYGHGPGYYGG